MDEELAYDTHQMNDFLSKQLLLLLFVGRSHLYPNETSFRPSLLLICITSGKIFDPQLTFTRMIT
jgi:hypothetical protein